MEDIPFEPRVKDAPAVIWRHTPHCTCGRFAKWMYDRYSYNGLYTVHSMTVRCAHCGLVTIDLI